MVLGRKEVCKRLQKLQIRTGLSSSRSHVATPILVILPLMEGFGYSKKLEIEKANLSGVRGEGVGLIYSTYLPN